MRTTLDIDDEILTALKELARRHGMTLGQVVSDLARKSMPQDAGQQLRNGVRLFARSDSGRRSDLRVVNSLRDEA